MKRLFLAIFPALLFFAATGEFAAAQSDYPNRPIRVVVPWPAGGIADVVLRVIKPSLEADLGQPLVIDDRAGAGGVIGDNIVVRSPPDGYTLLFTSSALDMNVALGRDLPYVPARDLLPIVNVAFAPMVLVASPSLNVKTAKELVALAKAKPGKLTYASAGYGSPAHLTAVMFVAATGIKAVHVPYKGSPQAMNDQIAGRVDFHFANPVAAMPQVKAGKVVGLFVTSNTRLAAAPELPTMIEAGFPEVRASQFEAFFAPAGTPSQVIDKISKAVNKALAQPKVAAALAPFAVEVDGHSSPQKLETLMKEDLERWIKVVKVADIKPTK